ncbi:methyltransferase domain-containing protein [Chelativorans sp. ZYF759]|uniref:phospholipid N-methyltransferase PmtA n=1 Tax=Chelativorans sp. ZYF759 TaxID=2692213 RepID=UPI00145D4B5E|nr:class I SAM-dependent methyltransferase [Chelativorans sp. ZYF759]NMG40757.1 methyltransferase domain-containing protein [Chelativorans sp. ZYF759]
MNSHAGNKPSGNWSETVRFFKGWLDKPRAVGSIVPTSATTAREMASLVDTASDLPVLELGPGTGVITKAILDRGVQPESLWAIEYAEDFVEHLRKEYPQVNVIQGDAFNLDDTLGDKKDTIFDSIVSAVPLLNFPVPQRIAYVEDLLNRIPVGRPIMQITYGPRSPVPPGKGNYTVERHGFVLRNVPPAHLWVYRRAKVS